MYKRQKGEQEVCTNSVSCSSQADMDIFFIESKRRRILIMYKFLDCIQINLLYKDRERQELGEEALLSSLDSILEAESAGGAV
jgi:hypothetical protein